MPILRLGDKYFSVPRSVLDQYQLSEEDVKKANLEELGSEETSDDDVVGQSRSGSRVTAYQWHGGD